MPDRDGSTKEKMNHQPKRRESGRRQHKSAQQVKGEQFKWCVPNPTDDGLQRIHRYSDQLIATIRTPTPIIATPPKRNRLSASPKNRNPPAAVAAMPSAMNG